MKKIIKSSLSTYTGEPSSLEYGKHVSNYYASLKTKYSPFELTPRHWDRNSTRVSDYTAEKVDAHGYTYYHISIRNYDNSHEVYGPFEVAYDIHDEQSMEFFGDVNIVKDYKVGEFASLDEAMAAIM